MPASLPRWMPSWRRWPMSKAASMFFFEKKNQKTFIPLPRAKEEKSFCFFFFRKRRLFLSSPGASHV
jgi:hypothetical protein